MEPLTETPPPPTVSSFQPDPDQAAVLAHDRGPLLVTGGPGTGKTEVLRERFARLVEGGADPDRVALVVRTRPAREDAQRCLLRRLQRAMPVVRVSTIHGLAHHVLGLRFSSLGYEQPPGVVTAAEQFGLVRELLSGEDPRDWPAYGSMLRMRGFADQVRQLLLRAQEALLSPEEVAARAEAAELGGWRELAAFYQRYRDVLDQQGAVDFAGLVVQAARAAGEGDPPFDHLMVDDYQEATYSAERLIVDLRPPSLVVAGDAESHVFSFQGTTDAPLRRFAQVMPTARAVELTTGHRSEHTTMLARCATHSSEEHAAVARELRRIHAQEGVPWSRLAVVTRRQGPQTAGLVRALDDAGVPRVMPEDGLSPAAEPATALFVLALRWLGRPAERDGLVESLLTSDLGRLSPAAARGLVRAARAERAPASTALDRTDGLDRDEAEAITALRDALGAAGAVSERSALDAFAELWRRLPSSARLVEAADRSAEARRGLDAVLAFSDAVSAASERGRRGVAGLLDALEGSEEGPGAGSAAEATAPAVRVLTAHSTAGLEFDTVIVTGALEGDFPSLARPEPMFDLALLDAPILQSDRNRLRLEDERRLFRLVAGRARRRVIFTASDPRGDQTLLTARSRFVGELGVAWEPAPAGPFAEPLTVAEAASAWRRTLATHSAPAPERLAGLDGLTALGVDPTRWWYQRDWTDAGRALHEGIRVSYSKLSKLENCALQFVLAEELGLESRAGYHAWVGHLVHRLIEDCEAGVIPRDLGELLAEAERRWRPAQFPSFAVSEAFRRLVVGTMLPAWFAEYGQAPPAGKERRFEFDFEGALVTGAIDRIGWVASGGSQITDYKTGKFRNAEPAETNLQLGMYYLAVNQAEDLAPFRPVRGVELAFLRDKDRTGAIARTTRAFVSRVEPEYRQVMGERLTGLIDQIRELLETETYRPNPGANCRFCEFKSLCSLWPEGRELFPVGEAGT